MSSSKKLSVIPGSERQPVRGARAIRNSSPDQVIEVSVRLRPKAASSHAELRTALMQSRKSLAEGKFQPMSRREFEAAHGADPADLAKLKKFAQEQGLKVHETGTELARRTVVLSGTVANQQKAFNVELKEYSHPTGHFRGRSGPVSVPAEYADIIEGVFGLDDRPQAAPTTTDACLQDLGSKRMPQLFRMTPTKWDSYMTSRRGTEVASA